MTMTTDPLSPNSSDLEIATPQSPDDGDALPEYGGPSEDPILQAMYRVVHRYPGGIDSLAKQINRTSKYLIKAVSGLPGAKLNIEDAQAITRITGDMEMLRVLAKQSGRKLVKRPPPTTVSDEFEAHAVNVMRQLGLCITLSTASGPSSLLRVPVVMNICNFIQLAMPYNDATSISPNQYRKLCAAYMSIDQDAYAGTSIHLQLHADLFAAFVTLQRKVPAHAR